MELTSPAFADGDPIPARYTCDGDNTLPDLAWTGVPDDAVSLAITCEDPDAPTGTFVHWLVWGIDPGAGGVTGGRPPAGAKQGRNDFGAVGYGGPCPPKGHGMHHYRFTLHASSAPIDLAQGAKVGQLRSALRPVTVAKAVLTGTYRR